MARDDYYASPFGVVYSTYMERPRLSRRISRLVWGGDTAPYYESMAAVAEAARVLAPGGRLVGSSFVRGRDTLRQRLLIRPHTGDFGPLGTQAEIESWLADAGLDLTSGKRSGLFLFFEAHKRT